MIYSIKVTNQSLSVKKVLSIIVMVLGLLLLTGANFIVYNEHFICSKTSIQDADKNETEAPSPVEEKSKSTNGGPTVQEEYLHDHKHSFREFAWLDILLRHRILDAEKLQIVHYELISPPPKMA